MDRDDEVRGEAGRGSDDVTEGEDSVEGEAMEAASSERESERRRSRDPESESGHRDDRSRLSEIMERVNEALHRGRLRDERE